MAKLTNWLTTLGLGAGLMYFLDPDRGTRRRALVRDQFVHYKNDLDDAIDVGMRDLSNRANGLVHEITNMVSAATVDDRVLEQRIRARLGYLIPNASAIQVDVREGVAHLSGDILERDMQTLMAGVSKLKGVHQVENELKVHQNADNIPALQGLDRARQRRENSERNWMPSTRLLAGFGGMTLIMSGKVRGGIVGFIYKMSGYALLLRSVTNMPVRRSLGLTEDRNVIDVKRTFQLDAPVEQVYEFWNNFTNFPKFMANIKEVRDNGDGHYHWVAKGPVGVPVEWDAVVTENIPNEVIAWESVPASTVKNRGRVKFMRVNDQATQVDVQMFYNPPAGAIGHAVASIFGQDPETAMVEDINRLRTLFTEGKTTVEGKEVTLGNTGQQGRTRNQGGQGQ